MLRPRPLTGRCPAAQTDPNPPPHLDLPRAFGFQIGEAVYIFSLKTNAGVFIPGHFLFTALIEDFHTFYLRTFPKPAEEKLLQRWDVSKFTSQSHTSHAVKESVLLASTRGSSVWFVLASLHEVAFFFFSFISFWLPIDLGVNLLPLFVYLKFPTSTDVFQLHEPAGLFRHDESHRQHMWETFSSCSAA